MKVRFENCEVDIWKLRKGTVVAMADGEDLNYYHIMHFDFVNSEHNLAHLLVEDCCGHFPVVSSDLIWAEPS